MFRSSLYSFCQAVLYRSKASGRPPKPEKLFNTLSSSGVASRSSSSNRLTVRIAAMLRSKTLRLPEEVDMSAVKSKWLKSSVVIGLDGFSTSTVSSTISTVSVKSASSAAACDSSCSGSDGTSATSSVVADVSFLSCSSVVTATASLSSVTFPAASTVTSFSVTSSGTQAMPPSAVLTG